MADDLPIRRQERLRPEDCMPNGQWFEKLEATRVRGRARGGQRSSIIVRDYLKMEKLGEGQ